MRWKRIFLLLLILFLPAALALWLTARNSGKATLPLEAVTGPTPTLVQPARSFLPTVGVAPVIGWKAGETPVPAAGLRVQAFAAGLTHPRWLLPLPNGDVLVSEANAPAGRKGDGGIRGWVAKLLMRRAGAGGESPNRIVLLRDADGDGVAEQRSVLLSGLNSPVGMALVGDQLYVAEADKLTRFPFHVGETRISAPGVKVVDLPGGPINHHWVKTVLASADGTKLYVSIGSNSNVGENGMAAETDRADIWEVDAGTGEHRIFAYGLRNPNGMAWNPVTKELWTVVNERDELGSDLVPDYLTMVDLGDYFGWPCFYWGGYIDKRAPDCDADQAQYVRRPDYALGPHVAALGLSFAQGARLGPRFAEGAFVGEHGSWNRKPKSGYQVVFVPFVRGKPAGKPVPVLTGFLDAKDRARGRPVGVAIDRTGALLVADDAGGHVWRVSAK